MKQFNRDFWGKMLSFLMVVTLSLSLTACGQDSETNQPAKKSQTTKDSAKENSNQTDGTPADGAEVAGSGNILIAYFSVPLNDGVDTVARASRKESDDGTFGNVRFMANVIQKNVGGELFSIESAKGYPEDDMDDLLEVGYDEKADNARPELTAHIENLDQYDTIFVGYPNWNADLPMPLYSFFEEYDFSGKTIIPFVAHGGSGASGTVDTIAELEPDATVVDNPATVYWDELDDAESIVTDWVKSLNITK